MCHTKAEVASQLPIDPVLKYFGQVETMRQSQSFKKLMKMWNLDIYFQMRQSSVVTTIQEVSASCLAAASGSVCRQ